MARPFGYKRLNRKAKHLIRRLRHTRHASVQDVSIHELRHEINRSWWKKAKPMGRAPQTSAGGYRPLTRKARQLLTHLRRSKVWRVQQRLVNEIAREIEHGKRLSARVAASKPVRQARRAARKTAAVGRAARTRVQRAHEPHLARAERKHVAREAGTARTPVRERLAARDRTSLPEPQRGGGRHHRQARPEPAREPMRVKAVMVPRDTAPREPARTRT